MYYANTAGVPHHHTRLDVVVVVGLKVKKPIPNTDGSFLLLLLFTLLLLLLLLLLFFFICCTVGRDDPSRIRSTTSGQTRVTASSSCTVHQFFPHIIILYKHYIILDTCNTYIGILQKNFNPDDYFYYSLYFVRCYRDIPLKLHSLHIYIQLTQHIIYTIFRSFLKLFKFIAWKFPINILIVSLFL